VKKLEATNLEKNLKIIKDKEIDIEILRRKNELLCAENNSEIENLKSDIALAENNLKSELEESEEDKLECKLGSVSFKKMPDEWKYQDEILMAWIISLPARLKDLFLKITTTIKKAELKKQIIDNNEILFENSKLVDEDISHIELFLVNEEKSYLIEGIEIERQEPKFSYTIKNLKK
jgi:hypothetical protein